MGISIFLIAMIAVLAALLMVPFYFVMEFVTESFPAISHASLSLTDTLWILFFLWLIFRGRD
jgi:hypothetical protein